MKKLKEIHNFYKSDAWQQARQLKIVSQNGLCERCKKVGQEVHHKKHINIDNYKDAAISLNQSNLELLCKDCHNKEHTRFSKVANQKFDEDGNLII